MKNNIPSGSSSSVPASYRRLEDRLSWILMALGGTICVGGAFLLLTPHVVTGFILIGVGAFMVVIAFENVVKIVNRWLYLIPVRPKKAKAIGFEEFHWRE